VSDTGQLPLPATRCHPSVSDTESAAQADAKKLVDFIKSKK
jgi:hypothetical protein